MKNKEQDGFDSGRGSSSNPIQLPEVIVYGKKPLPWYKRALNGVAKFVNDEIFLNKDNIRVKNARRHPRAMDAVQEGGNIAGAIVAAPFAAYTAVQAAPVIMPALKVAGQAVTPSTWIGGVAQATGYQAPAWLLNGADLAASAYYANEAGKDIDKNGLTWRTGFNALMSLAPMTRETEAIEGVANTLRRPSQAVSSVVDDFRTARNAVSSPEAVLGREFSRSVKDTQLINVPIEHVSNKGVTEGAGLNAASSSDVGFHFSPAGSETTSNIQRATGAPFVRTGTWTYSNNTKPIFALDRGNWTYDFNPELYRGLNPGTTPSENALALSQRGPNYTYINNFEGQGGRSYMTTDPNFGIVLSRNREVSPKIRLNRAQSVHHPTSPDGREFYTNGQLMAEGASPSNFDIETFGDPVYRLQGSLYNRAVKPFVDDVRQMYSSNWYTERLKRHGFSPQQIASIQQRVNSNIDRTNYFVTDEALPYGWIGGSGTDRSTGIHGVALNAKHSNHPAYNTIIHETGHMAEVDINEINATNKHLADMIRQRVNFNQLSPQQAEDVKYFLQVYDDGSTELGGQVRNALVSMHKNNWTPEQYLQSKDFLGDYDLQKVADSLGEEKLKTILRYALGTVPISLLAKND